MPIRKSVSPTIDATAEKDTRTVLTQAAMAEFCEHGYGGTDSNRIARRAGFAPQTFYRWFKDKTEVFLAAYRAWEEQELALLERMAARQESADRMAGVILRHHRDHLLFRRSLRHLAVENPEVRQARAASRERQLGRILAWSGAAPTQHDSILIGIFQVERLADAVAENELQDLGVAEPTVRAAIADILERIRRS